MSRTFTQDAKKGGEAENAVAASCCRRGKQTRSMERWKKKFGGDPNYHAVGRAIGRHYQEVQFVFYETRSTQGVQDAVAKLAGMTVVELFGDMAWPRVAARFLEEQAEAVRQAS